MAYINLETKEYPAFKGDLMLQYPDWDGDDATLPEPWVEVEMTDLPELGVDETWVEELPVLNNGKYVQKFSIRSMTTEEIAERDAPLTAKARFIELGFSEAEIQAMQRGFIR
jgi:hypothetical protein